MIVALEGSDSRLIDELVDLSFAAAREHAPQWLPTRAHAREEIDDALEEGKLSFVAMAHGHPCGWVSGLHAYGRLWEIHPLLIAPTHQGQGHGRRLVEHIEARLIERGALTIFVGTSDETGATNMHQSDLYADPGAAISNFEARSDHAVRFWQHMGYTLVGMIPDAEGPGLPSLQLCKRVWKADR
jgi:aminoglycoside 6'-N-acetyltransferase I